MSIQMKLLTAGLAVSLGGCISTGGGYHVENATGQPIPQHALADEVYLDGTGPSARRIAHTRSAGMAERRYVAPSAQDAPARAVVRTRPTAIERADQMSSTTGSRHSVQAEASAADANKPFSDQWWEKERREDARLKRVMDICSGC